MALLVKDRVKETTTTTGIGTITLAGAVAGYQAFSAVGDGNTTYYAIVAQDPGEWEVGIGTYTASGTTLSRDTVLSSSNSGSAVDFSAGTKDVFVTYPAERSVTTTEAATLTNKTINGSNNTITNVSLTTGITGTLAAANGGTGLSSPGTSGNFLQSTGTGWTSAPVTIPPAVFDVCNTSNIVSCLSGTGGTGTFNFFAGTSAGACTTTGSNNILLGQYAGCNLTTGSNTVAIGAFAGKLANGGYFGNTFIGNKAGCCSISGGYNVHLGAYAGTYKGGWGNVAIGPFSMCGLSATAGTSPGGYNIGIGLEAGNRLTTGGCNAFVGHRAGRSTTTGVRNFFGGYNAGNKNTTGSNNILLGQYAGCNLTTGSNTVAIGAFAGKLANGGYFGNTFIGNKAGCCSISGGYNVHLGAYAGTYKGGWGNIALGPFAMCGQSGTAGTSTGGYNIGIGSESGARLTTGTYNAFIGNRAGRSTTTGARNFFGGYNAGHNNTTGGCNVFIGDCAGYFNTTASNNIFLGCCAGSSATTGIACITTQSNRIIMGNCLHSCAQIKVAWTVVSDCRDKCIFGRVDQGRGFLQNLEPIEYAFKDRETGCLTDPEGKRRYGFSAQNVLAAEGDNPVIVSVEDPDKLQLTSDYIVPILVNAVNELSAELDALKLEVAALKG